MLSGPAHQRFLTYTSDLMSRVNVLRSYSVASNGN